MAATMKDNTLFPKKNEQLEEIVEEVISEVVDKTIDVTKDIDKIITMTPKDGYNKKIELIMGDKDMNTQDKIRAIDEAEDKYAQDIKCNAETYEHVMRVKGRIIFCVIVGGGLVLVSPKGQQFIKKIIPKLIQKIG